MTLLRFAILVLLTLPAIVGAQTAPPLTATSTVASCTVTVRQSWAPTPNSGWGVQFTWQAVGASVFNFGNRDVTSPYTQTRTFQPGTYTLGGTWTRTGSPTVAIAPISYTCGTTTTPPPPPPPPAEVCGDGIDNDKDGQIDEGCASPPPPQPPPTSTIWGIVDPAILGEFTAAEHDRWTQDGGDGVRYRVPHAQCPASFPDGSATGGRCFAHEHGDDPATQRDPWVRANFDPRMGFAARRMQTAAEPSGHAEAHEGYKVFVVNVGDINGENRVNQTATTSMPHMGTSRPGRHIDHHSVHIAYAHQNGVHRAALRIMARTGGVAGVCDPRVQAPTKDGLVIGQPCKVDSPYEIWSMVARVEASDGAEVLEQLITPAVFDPITGFNRTIPSELVSIAPITDPRIQALKNHPSQDWTGHRGCSREGYSQVGYFRTVGQGSDQHWTDAMGNTLAATNPLALMQSVARGVGTDGNPPFSSNILQFKMRINYCTGEEQWQTANGWRPRPGVSGRVNRNKLGLKN